MHIKLTANSTEAQNYLSNLVDKKVSQSFSYNYEVGEQNEQSKQSSWGLNLLSKFEKTFFKKPLPDSEKEVIDYVSKSAEFLNNFFTKNESDYISNMSIVMNVNSRFNKLAKNTIDVVSSFYPSSFSEIKKHVDPEETSVELGSRKMIIGSSLFTEESSTEHPFSNFLIETIGKEKAVAFIVFHEASHTFQLTNIEKYDPIWDNMISNILLHSCELLNESPSKPNKLLIDVLNKEINKKSDKNFPFINGQFLEEILTLDNEIYADVGAILLARNADMEKGKYDSKNISKLIDFVIEARHKEFNFCTKNMPSEDAVSCFNHFTVPGLEYLKETLASLPEKVLSQKEIYDYATTASHKGLARVLLSSALANSENMKQLYMIFNLNDVQGNISLPDKICEENALNGLEGLDILAGDTWMDRFDNNMKKVQESNIADKTRAIWDAGTNQKLFEQNLALDNSLSSNSVKDKDDALNAIDDIRNKILTNSNSVKNKI